MNLWKDLSSVAGLEALLAQSHTRPQLIVKHSTRCGVSAHVFDGLQDASASLAAALDLHYLDLLAFRPVSNEIATRLGVVHQSPQAIVVWQGKAIESSSHYSISPARILASVQAVSQP